MTEETTERLGFPILAGLCSYGDADRVGLGVDETVDRLKRYHWVLRGLMRVAAAHFARTPEWEVKCGLGLHLWLDAEHATLLRARVAEMREPPLRLDDPPDAALDRVLLEALRADGTDELLAAIHGVIRPSLVAALRAHLAVLNPLFDHPTLRVLRQILGEQEDALAWG